MMLRRMRGRAAREVSRGWITIANSGPSPNITSGFRKSR